MRGVRVWSAAAVAASALALTSPPASAATAIVFEGTAEIGCYGCGWYGPDGNSASFSGTGVVNNEIVLRVPGSMRYTVNQATGSGCVAGGVLDGQLTISTPLQEFNSRFTLYLTGAAGEMFLHDVPWRGTLVWAVTSPVGNPCGGGVVIRFAGELVGA